MSANFINQEALEQKLLELLDKLPAFVVDAAGVYVPAMTELLCNSTLEEVVAFQRLILKGLNLEALAALRQKMSAQELAAEKEQLAELTKLIAEEQYKRVQLGKSILSAILKAGMIAAMAAVGF